MSSSVHTVCGLVVKFLVIKKYQRNLKHFYYTYYIFGLYFPEVIKGLWISWFVTLRCPLKSEGQTFNIAKENKVFFFAVKKFKLLVILLPLNCITRLVYLLKLVLFERDSEFWKQRTVFLSLKTVENLCPKFQKPPLPSKTPGYAPDVLAEVLKLF